MMNMFAARRPARRLVFAVVVLFAVVALLLTTAGCDSTSTGEGETVVLQPEELTFRFQFEGGQADGSGSLDVTSEEAVSVEDVLPLAYVPEDVQRVTITDVTLERIQPLENLSAFLTRTNFAVDGVGDPQIVASLGSPPDARQAEMTVSTAGITDLVTDQAFRGVLQLLLVEPDLRTYVLEVRMTVQIEVLDV
ncbi:MAG: hypothetical protein GVY18_18785 [Bacteroidetes bacterium]|nr:hypothetical protein [Bacteroidota bacterium]